MEIVADGVTLIVTLSVDEAQGRFATVQRNTFAPTAKPVTPEFGADGVVIVPVPLTKVQVPVPAVGVLAAKVVLLAVIQIV